MAEVRVIARALARKGKEDQLRSLLQGMLAPTRAEAGCISYELYESDSRGRFYFDEAWESQAALDKHIATPHFKHLEQKHCGIDRRTFRGKYSEKDSGRCRRSVTCAGCRTWDPGKSWKNAIEIWSDLRTVRHVVSICCRKFSFASGKEYGR